MKKAGVGGADKVFTFEAWTAVVRGWKGATSSVMWILMAGGEGAAEYEGETYTFCCAGCKTTFEKDPARYVGTAVSSGTISLGEITID